jgi:6-phosphogluconolactonase
MKIFVFDRHQELADGIADFFQKTVEKLLKEQDHCAVVLSGGSTPKLFLSRLALEPYRSSIPWHQLYFFWGDERYVPLDHSDSNFRMACETLLSRVPVPSDHLYPMPVDEQNLENAARHYETVLRQFFKRRHLHSPRFDILFLGIGADGHTASLFPGSPALLEKKKWVIPIQENSRQTKRLSLSLPVFNHAGAVIFVAQGRNKSQTLKKVFENNDARFRPLPAQMIRPLHGSLRWFVDHDAASALKQKKYNSYVLNS